MKLHIASHVTFSAIREPDFAWAREDEDGGDGLSSGFFPQPLASAFPSAFDAHFAARVAMFSKASAEVTTGSAHFSPKLSQHHHGGKHAHVVLKQAGSASLAPDGPSDPVSQAQVDALESGFEATLTSIASNLVAQVFAETLPVLGNNLADAAGAGAAQLQYVSALKSAIVSGLGSLSGSATYTETQVESAINSKLSAGGFGSVDFNAGNPNDITASFTTAKNFGALTVPIEADLGLPNLGLRTSGNAQSTFNYALNFGAGLDAGGFYLGTGAGTTFTVQTATTLPGFNASAQLGGLPVVATNSPGAPAGFTGTFNVALKDGNADGKLRSSELGGDLLDATLTGQSQLGFKLVSDLPVAAALPKLQTNLDALWRFTGAPVDPLDNNADFGEVPSVTFRDNALNLGSFFNGFAGDALQTISDITAPLAPVIEVLTAPIPILSDLGSSKVTLLNFAGVEPETVSAIEGLSDIIDLVQLIAGFSGNDGVLIQLGSVDARGDLRSEPAEDLLVALNSAPPPVGNQDADVASFLASVNNLGGGGLSFPLLTEPTRIGELFLGKNVDLFDYAPPSVGFDFAFSQYFPVLGVIGITLGGKFGFSFVFDIGFDTQGVRDFVAGGSTDASKVFNGFFVRAFDEASAPVTGFSVLAGVTAGVEANIGIANAGVEGDLTATVTFNFDAGLDPDGDGKIRGDTLTSTPVGDLFDPTGELTTGLRAYLEVGISPFSIEFDFESPRITLLNFEGDTTQPVLASDGANGDLLLNVGPRSAERLVGNLTDRPETVLVNNYYDPLFPNDPPIGVRIDAFKIAQVVERIPGRIVGDGGEKSDKLELAADVNIPAVFTGGLSRDVLTGGAAGDSLSGDDGPDVLSGNGGVDTLRGGIGNDHLTGGAGGDVLDGGDGSDTASYLTASAGMTIDVRTNTFTGDGVGDSLISIERYEGTNFDDTINGDDTSNSLLSGIDGVDILRGFAGNDLLDGGAGDDTLEGGADADFLVGGPGADRLDGGDGIDSIAYTSSKTPVIVSLRTGLGTGGDAQGDVLVNVEVLYGSPLPFGDLKLRIHPQTGEAISTGTGDTLEGSDGPDAISGFGGADSIDGGAGDDVLYGDAAGTSGNPPSAPGFDDDILRGGLGNDQLFGQQDDDDLDGGPGQDTLEGGAGNDHLRTLDTASIDVLDGGPGINRLSADYSDKPVAITWIAGQLNDYTFADGDLERNFQNVGELDTASFNDLIRLDGAADDDFSNIIRTNAGDDVVYTGGGLDTVEGGAGDDILYSGADSDLVDGGDGHDFVNGGGNNVRLTWGGPFNGTVTGFTGPAEVLAGGAGTDTLSFVDIAKASPDNIPIGVHVDLGGDTTDFGARGVTISGFENLTGTEYGDDLRGTEGANIINPLHGGGYTQGFGSGPDHVYGKGGIDTVVIDFSREDLSSSTGVTSAAGNGTAENLAFYSRQTPASPFWHQDATYVTGIEQYHITGASKNDQITGGSLNYDDILLGLGGDDTLSGQGGGDRLLGGEGNDVLSGQGLNTQAYNGTAGGLDFFDGGAGDDLVEDIALDGANVPTAPAPGALFQLDGGAGFDTLSVTFSNRPEAVVWTSAAPTDITFPDGASARNFEQLRYVASGAGNDSITQLGRYNNLIYTNGGDDIIAPGLGFDTVNGGADNDLLVLDYSVGDLPTYTGVSGGGNNNIFRRDIPDSGQTFDYVAYSGFERLLLTGTPRADTLADFVGDDIIFGAAGNDVITSPMGGNNTFDGGDGNDTLTGNGNSAANVDDTFIGGDGNDILTGLAGHDTLLGGAGGDVLIGASDFGFGPGGRDLIDGGEGDDFVDESYAVSEAFQYMPVGTVLKLEGGPGFDTLSADFGRETQGIVFVAGQVNANEFASGAYIRNFEAIRDFTTGTGPDVLTQPGRIDNQFSTREGNDIINPGLGIDIVWAGPGDDLFILDYSLGDDANLGGVTFNNGTGQRRDTATNALVDSGSGSGFERFQITGGSKADNLTGGGGADVLSGGAGNDTLNGGTGDDLLDGGTGADAMNGGAGNDRYVVDSLADVITENAGAGNDTVTALIDYMLAPNGENLVLGGRALSGTGNALANIITGNARNNSLDGGDGDDVLTGGFGIGLAGSQEVDRLHGGGGADTFVLGDAAFRFYDDRSSLTPGTGGYARIDDFTPTQGDKLQLKGAAAEYLLGTSPVVGVPGSALFHDTDLDGQLDPAHDELLAILEPPDTLTFANTIGTALFV